MDARNLGHGRLLPLDLLEAAAHGYLTDDEWDMLPDTWLADALAMPGTAATAFAARSPRYAHVRANRMPTVTATAWLTTWTKRVVRPAASARCPRRCGMRSAVMPPPLT